MKPVMDVLRILWTPRHPAVDLARLTALLDSQDRSVAAVSGAADGLEREMRRMAGELR